MSLRGLRSFQCGSSRNNQVVFTLQSQTVLPEHDDLLGRVLLPLVVLQADVAAVLMGMKPFGDSGAEV